jgi:hypothetical protein
VTSAAVSPRDSGARPSVTTCPARARSVRVWRSRGASSTLLLARGDHDEQSLGRSPARQVREQAQRQLVGPVEILQHDEHRIAGRQTRQQRGDGLEQTPVVHGGRRQRGGGHLGQQASELDAPGRVQRLEDLAVAVELRHAQGVDDRTEEEDPIALVRTEKVRSEVALVWARHRCGGGGGWRDEGSGPTWGSPTHPMQVFRHGTEKEDGRRC